jgi:plasmid stabilization system protein ParE
MAEEFGSSGERIVIYSRASRMDIASIHLYNTNRYGEEHADLFVEDLMDAIEDILDDPVGRPVAQRPGIRVMVFKSTRRRSAHGYQVYWKSVARGIEVVRILHTAMDAGLHLPE